MSRFADLAIKKDRSEDEDQELHVLAQQLDYVAADLGTVIGPSGVVSWLRAGSVVLDNAGMHTYLDGVETGRIEADGDFLLGSDVAAAATTSFAVFTNAQTYNSESIGAGDVLLGDNTASKANILWDASAGTLLFRGGTTAHGYIDTDGAATFGSGAVILNSSGFTIKGASDDSPTAVTSAKWIDTNDANVELARIVGYGRSGKDRSWLEISAGGNYAATDMNRYAMLELAAWGGAADETLGNYAAMYLWADGQEASGTEQVLELYIHKDGGTTLKPIVVERDFSVASAGSIIFNEDSHDIDTRIETSGDANAIFANGGTDNVGIGTATPTSKFQVAGAMSSATVRLSAAGPTDGLNVAGVNTVFVDTSSNNVTLGGTVGGVDGQVLNILVHVATNNFTIEHDEVGFKNQLVSWWELNEESGERADSHGSNNLEDINTVLYTTGKVGNCADFELSNSENLRDANRWDTAGYPVGHNALSIGVWVRIEAKPGTSMTILSGFNTEDNDRVAQILWQQTTDRFRFAVSHDGTNTTTIDADTLGAPAINTWYYINAYHDPDTDLIGIQVNNGGWDTAAHVGGIHDPTFAATRMRLGARCRLVDLYWDGEIDEAFIAAGILIAADWTTLYNSGSGRAYSDLEDVIGGQRFFLHAGADETMTSEYGGWVFVNDGGEHWHDASHAKHV